MFAPEIIASLYKVRMAFNTNSVAQVAALAAWDDRDHVQKSVSMNRAELDFLYRGLSRYLNCWGHGTCGTCRVLVKKGMENLSSKGWLERFTLGRMMATVGHEDEMRLACQVQVHGDCTIETQPAVNWSGENFWQKPYPNK